MIKLKEEIEFLEYVYQNAKMGIESIARLIQARKKQDKLDKVFREQLHDYNNIAIAAKNMLKRRNKDVKDISIMSKIATYMTIKINLAKSDADKEAVDMMIKGSEMGIEQIKKHVEEYKVKSKTILNLANRLISIEENNIRKLKKI